MLYTFLLRLIFSILFYHKKIFFSIDKTNFLLKKVNFFKIS